MTHKQTLHHNIYITITIIITIIIAIIMNSTKVDIWDMDELFHKFTNFGEKKFFQKMGFFRGLRLSLGHLANKSLKAMCLSSKMVYQHLLYLLSLWTY